MEEKRQHGWAICAVVVLMAVVVGYPLSSGPAIALYGATGRNETFGHVGSAMYEPLAKLPESFHSALQWWDLWDFYGVRT